jgi:hypothetical protein
VRWSLLRRGLLCNKRGVNYATHLRLRNH